MNIVEDISQYFMEQIHIKSLTIQKNFTSLSLSITWPIRHLYNIPSNDIRIHIFYKCTCNVTKIAHILVHKTSLTNISMLTDYNEIYIKTNERHLGGSGG